MAPVRIGFIGLSTRGWAAATLVNPLFDPLLSSSYSLTALCTTSEASAIASAEKYTDLAGHKVKAYYGEDGVHKIANDPDVDLVAISVRMPQHYNAVMPAIEAGKDVFIEWIPGITYEETVKMAEAAKKKGVRVLVGAQGIQLESMKKVKQIVDSGKIGRILSTTAIISSPGPPDTMYWSDKATPSIKYCYDIKNGASPLNVTTGHFLTIFTHTLGDALGEFAEISASGAIQYPFSEVIDVDGKPTGEIITKTVHDQLALSGTFQNKGSEPGAFYNLHVRAVVPMAGERARGRTIFKWIIDGELGTIEVQNIQELPTWDVSYAMTDSRVLVNGEEVKIDVVEADRLGAPGKAWLEFAKGERGVYYDLEKSVKIHQVLDAALTSIQEGRRISLV